LPSSPRSSSAVYRNYFVPTVDLASGQEFQGQCSSSGGRQINLVADVEGIVDNEKNVYWTMSNGYLMPGKGKMAAFNEALKEGGEEFGDRIVESIRAGVQWDTEVASNGGLVCQGEGRRSEATTAYLDLP